MNMMKRVFVLFVFAVAVSVGVDAAKISVNLAEDNGGAAQTVLPTEAAGAQGFEAYNWNNFIQSKKNTSLALMDDGGAATGSMINFKVSNGWGDNTADTTPNGKIARGYFDDGQTSTGIGVDIEVTNVTYPVYHVILLLSADSTDGNWGTFSVNGVSKAGGPKLRYNTVNGFVVGRNAMLFENITGTTLNIHCPPRSGTTRGTIAGFQIVLTEKAHGATPATGTKNVPLDQIFSWVSPRRMCR